MTYRKKCANPECDVIFESVYPQQKYCIKCGFSRVGEYKKHPRPKVKKVCPVCGITFLAPEGCSKLGNEFQKFCSPTCATRASQLRKIEFDKRWSDETKVR